MTREELNEWINKYTRNRSISDTYFTKELLEAFTKSFDLVEEDDETERE